jgi:hypothetical protein
MINIVPQNDSPRKRCPKCEKFLLATPEVFGVAKRAKDGLNRCCKVCRRKHPNRTREKPFTIEQREEICQRYIAGESTVAIAKTYGKDKTFIRLALIKQGITRRENTPELHRIYQCNHAYFDQTLDEERAYWIGFLLADGYVTGHKIRGASVIGMSLSVIDTAHVERFKTALQSNHPIGYHANVGGYGAGKQMVRFAFASQELVNAVARYGIVEHKTKICVTPQLPPELMCHMYRGYVDGDGGLSLYKIRRWLNAAFDVVGTESFLKDFALWLAIHAKSNPNVPLKAKGTTAVMNLRYGGLRQVSDILHVLYDDATIYLERKLITAQKIWDAAEQQQSYRRNDYIS